MKKFLICCLAIPEFWDNSWGTPPMDQNVHRSRSILDVSLFSTVSVLSCYPIRVKVLCIITPQLRCISSGHNEGWGHWRWVRKCWRMAEQDLHTDNMRLSVSVWRPLNYKETPVNLWTPRLHITITVTCHTLPGKCCVCSVLCDWYTRTFTESCSTLRESRLLYVSSCSIFCLQSRNNLPPSTQNLSIAIWFTSSEGFLLPLFNLNFTIFCLTLVSKLSLKSGFDTPSL